MKRRHIKLQLLEIDGVRGSLEFVDQVFDARRQVSHHPLLLSELLSVLLEAKLPNFVQYVLCSGYLLENGGGSPCFCAFLPGLGANFLCSSHGLKDQSECFPECKKRYLKKNTSEANGNAMQLFTFNNSCLEMNTKITCTYGL